MKDKSPVLELRNVYLSYEKDQVNVLQNISLKIPKGSTCALIGASGAGKTTLLRIIAGLTPVSAGKVEFLGHKIDTKKLTIGFMPQSYGLLPWKTVRENIILGTCIKKGKKALQKEEYETLVKDLGLLDLLARYPKEISGGQKQRVALGRVFLLQPDLLLMDEPFSALDAITREEMQEVFLRIWQKRKTTTVIVTHYVEEALLLGQKIVIISADGTKVYDEENPFFGDLEARREKDFFQRATKLRKELHKGLKGA